MYGERALVAQVFMAGFLPFSAIYIELHYIFASVWGHKLYTLYGARTSIHCTCHNSTLTVRVHLLWQASSSSLSSCSLS